MEKKELLKNSNSKMQVQQAVAEKQIMAGLRHRNVVQVCCARVLVYVCYPDFGKVAVFLTCSFLLHRKRVTHLPQLCHAFQSNSKLYMVIDLCPGGTL